MPDEVLTRANEVLKIYENEGHNPKEDRGPIISQIAFDLDSKPVNNELKEYIDGIDALNVTPLEAINILFKIKDLNRK